ncbi:MAG: S8 family serine peptidase [Xenococcaceae cyanobacterium MO_234.B1]|nr:S8 family serine peptidase [Xenococcaceae cyanobacterium MO_234.B1]
MNRNLLNATWLLSLTTFFICGFSFSTQAQTLKRNGEKSYTKINTFWPLLEQTNAPTASIQNSQLVPALPPIYDGYVLIDAAAEKSGQQLYADLSKMGLQQGSVYGRVVSGMFPVDRLSAMEELESLRFAWMSLYQNNIGATTSQGVVAMGADLAQANFGVDGTGTKVGILSDSYDILGGEAEGIASGDLSGIGNPFGHTTPVQVLEEGPAGSIDEGRGIAEIITDIAPKTDLAFATAFGGQAGFANNILRLAENGATTIVDDVIYFAEPMFQDGIIAQAVDQVVNNGVAYFSSAGNTNRDSYQGEFINSETFVPGIGLLHDFDPEAGVDFFQEIELRPGITTLIYQWDEPFFSVSGGPGASSDLDLYLFDEDLNFLFASDFSNIGMDPIEGFRVNNIGDTPVTVNLAIALSEGEAPSLQKYVLFGRGRSAASRILDFPTNSSTIYGHSNAQGAIAVGAAFYQDTLAFGQNPPLLESFSSAGGTPILFDLEGNRLGSPQTRLNPTVVAPDGVNTTFFPPSGIDVEGDGFPNFFGTSAAAPHAAAVAALMQDANPYITPAEIREILARTAIDMGSEGYDFDTGYGFINAERAVKAAIRKVPEPSSFLGFLSLGTLGAVLTLKRKLKLS